MCIQLWQIHVIKGEIRDFFSTFLALGAVVFVFVYLFFKLLLKWSPLFYYVQKLLFTVEP